ncbi:MAG: hypothetical protein FD133_511 [Erysipelotrichaceae bacterium]|nr:MAG: hypothetical protein FD179_28 [Erysipelotrichaceae bacterium]TXT19075.1 MAG: hypothetical protein FD133_511 [Erysipelotrichaceae bacterium]
MRKVPILLGVMIIMLTLSTFIPIKAISTSVKTNQYTQPESVIEAWTNNQVIPTTYQKISENTTFVLYANSETLAFKVLDKRSGYVWHSNLDEVTEADKLNKTWTAFAQSGLSMDYITSKATSKRLDITRDNPNINFTTSSNGFSAKVSYAVYGLGYTINVSLEEKGIHVEIPKSSIVQSMINDYRIDTIHVYPFFGSTILDNVPGYFFIPDGSGALLRFSKETKANTMFYGRYYGNDLGMFSENTYYNSINPAYDLSLPIYGMVHGVNQHAYTVIVEKGSAYGRLRLHPAGVTTQFNFAYNSFIYNEAYFQATNRSGAGVDALQKKTNEFDVSMHYRFLDSVNSDYVGMALDYQDYLADKNELKQNVQADEHIGIKLEFLGGEKTRFLFWDIPHTVTTLPQMKAILEDLKVNGVFNPEVIYYGWQPLGASHMMPTSFNLESKLGSLSTLKSLISWIDENKGTFSLYVNPQIAIRNASGYSTRTDLAMSITNKNLLSFDRNKVNYLFNLKNVSKRLLGVDKVNIDEIELAIGTMGYDLYSDFKSSNFLNREDAISAYRQIWDTVKHPLSFYKPNDYALKYTRNIYDIPVTNSGYVYTSDTVPFLQIALSGHINMYSTALNFSSNILFDRLRLVDFNVYPSFFLTHEATSKILDTRSNWIYSSAYKQWGSEIASTYMWMDNLLSQVKGAKVIERTIPRVGLSVIDYSNGQSIVVNYTDQDILFEGHQVKAFDAICTVLP